MAGFEPFHATTYDPARVVADDVIAPPYDVVSPAERSALARRSPYNAIHVELPSDEPGSSLDRYGQAARLWRRWHEEGVVEVDPVEALYLYRMTFRDVQGEVRSTTGVLGALGLDPDRTGEVLPHEETTPKDKHDRLSLLRAARTNFSPLWVLSVADGLAQACDEAVLGAGEPWSATDDEGVLHERWRLEVGGGAGSAGGSGGRNDARRLAELIAEAPVLVADGHHRYETACTYLEERPGDQGADRVLALAVALSDEQLAVEAIHRVVRGVDPERFPRDLEKWFVVTPAPDRSDDLAAARATRREGEVEQKPAAGDQRCLHNPCCCGHPVVPPPPPLVRLFPRHHKGAWPNSCLTTWRGSSAVRARLPANLALSLPSASSKIFASDCCLFAGASSGRS